MKKASTLLLIPTLFFSSISFSLFAQCEKDIFDIIQFYPTKEGTREWNSAHWANGEERTIKKNRDTYDPTNWTEDRSGSSDGFYIDGNGLMKMSGGSPRFHINSMHSTTVSAQHFLNTEFTAYYRRIGSNGKNYGGMVVGARSGPLGHGSPGGSDCDATTYHARFRNDGKWDFEKELKHSATTYWSGSGYNKQDYLWAGKKTLPENKWIGMKYLVYNIENNTKVKLEVYIDSTSNGNVSNGGNWEKVGEVIDDGNWPVGQSNIIGCDYSDPKTIILNGNGTFLLRTDGDAAEYKMVSIREIDTSVEPAYQCLTTSINSFTKQEPFWYKDQNSDAIKINTEERFSYEIISLNGITHEKGYGNKDSQLGSNLSTGLYIIKIQTASTNKQIRYWKE